MSIAHLNLLFKRHSVESSALHLVKRHMVAFLFCFSIAGCEGTSSAPVPLLTACTPSTASNQLSLGIGKDQFDAMEFIDHALIVGGYQGGHHLWGAVRFEDNTVLEGVGRLHMMVCDNEQIIAQALYGSVNALLRSESDLYGIPIVFRSGVDVERLDQTNITVLVGVETSRAIFFADSTVELKCCGHVADGD